MANSSPPIRATTAPSPACSRIVPATPAQQSVADVIAVAVVDGAEAMKLERDDQQRACVLTACSAKVFGAVGKALAVEQAGDRVGRGRNRRAALAVEPPLRFMLKVDVPAPAEEDQRDVEGQRDRCDLSARTEDDLGAAELAEEGRCRCR